MTLKSGGNGGVIINIGSIFGEYTKSNKTVSTKNWKPLVEIHCERNFNCSLRKFKSVLLQMI